MQKLLLSSLIVLSGLVAAQQTDTAKARQELDAIRSDISRSEQQRLAQQQQLQNAQTSLQQADEAHAKASQAVAMQQASLAEVAAQLSKLQQQKELLASQRQQQQQALALQLKAAYQIGGHDYTQLLLNQQSAQKLERVLTYYQYFNNARMQQLQALKKTVDELAQLAQETERKSHEQQQRLAELQQQQQTLADAKAQQTASIRQLQQVLSDQQQQLAYLKQNEKSLQSTIAELKAKAAARRMQFQQKSKGVYPWPVTGTVVQRFGSTHGGESKASGIIISAKPGQPVKAVADGQVIYADWLKGYGYVIVLDHGGGLMTLYGHNESLLRSPGDIVKTGQHLALVGQSGGQQQVGLYFEVRQKGTAVDPLAWLRNP